MARPPVKTPAERNDPYLTFQFVVEVKGLEVGGFSEVSGLELETDVEKFREGGLIQYEHQLAGPTKFPSRIVLKKGVTGDVLWSWHQKVAQGRVERKQLAIVLKDAANNELRRWTFQEAAPVKWVGPQFRASGAEVAVETLELIHNGLVP